MTIDLASYNEGIRAGRRDGQASHDELLELARQWRADANKLRKEKAWMAFGQAVQLMNCADQLTRLLRVRVEDGDGERK